MDATRYRRKRYATPDQYLVDVMEKRRIRSILKPAITGDGWTHLDNIDGPTLKLHILKIYRGIHRYKSGVVGVMGSRRKRKG